jgi:hypothetical protein
MQFPKLESSRDKMIAELQKQIALLKEENRRLEEHNTRLLARSSLGGERHIGDGQGYCPVSCCGLRLCPTFAAIQLAPQRSHLRSAVPSA